MTDHSDASNRTNDTTDTPFVIGEDPGAAQLDRIEGHTPLVEPVASLDERFALRDRTMGESESASLFSSVSSTHPLDEEHAEDEEDHSDDKGDPVSPYASIYALAALKSGKLRTKKAFGGQNDRLKWARIFRPQLVRHVAENRGWRLRTPEWAYLHPRVQRMSANPRWEADVTGSGLYVPIEAQVVAGSERWKWQNAAREYIIPVPTMLRVQHTLAVTGCRFAMVLALFGGYEEKVFSVERDEALIADIEAGVEDFWKMIDAGNMPEPDYGRDKKIIQQLNAKIDPEKMLDWTANNEAQQLLSKKAHLQSEITEREAQVEKIDARLWEMMGDASAAHLGDTILGVSVVQGAEVNYYRDTYKKFQKRKPQSKHAGASQSKSKRSKKEA